MLSSATVTIASLRVITCDLPRTRTTREKQWTRIVLFIIIIKTIVRTIITRAHLELSLVTCLEQEPKIINGSNTLLVL
jgi:hypothetical protein